MVTKNAGLNQSTFSFVCLHSMARANLNKSENFKQILPQHQNTYLGGQESASIEIPLFMPKSI